MMLTLVCSAEYTKHTKMKLYQITVDTVYFLSYIETYGMKCITIITMNTMSIFLLMNILTNNIILSPIRIIRKFLAEECLLMMKGIVSLLEIG